MLSLRFNYWISEYFDTPAPAQNVLVAATAEVFCKMQAMFLLLAG